MRAFVEKVILLALLGAGIWYVNERRKPKPDLERQNHDARQRELKRLDEATRKFQQGQQQQEAIWNALKNQAEFERRQKERQRKELERRWQEQREMQDRFRPAR